MPIFYRNIYSQLWITLSSNEVLGVLDSDYLEDYYGVDGQITLRHSSGQEFVVLMNELTSTTPSIPHDVFTGYVDLDSIPNGDYEVRGRVRDVIGNYTILGEVENPFGDENIISLLFTVSFGLSNIAVTVGPMKLSGGITLVSELDEQVSMSSPLRALGTFVTKLPELKDFVMYLPEEPSLSLSLQKELDFTTKKQAEPVFTMGLQTDKIFNGELRGD